LRSHLINHLSLFNNIMKTNFTSLFFLVIFGFFGFSQNENDSDRVNLDSIQDLTPVVLTGQYRPQVVDKSIFEVDVLTQTDLRKMAGNTLDDVLNQTLNLNVI